jgi:hypothetical protein
MVQWKLIFHELSDKTGNQKILIGQSIYNLVNMMNVRIVKEVISIKMMEQIVFIIILVTVQNVKYVPNSSF